MKKDSNDEKEAIIRAFNFSVDYKPFDENLHFSEYAKYGYQKGFLDGITHERQCKERIEIRQINRAFWVAAIGVIALIILGIIIELLK